MTGHAADRGSATVELVLLAPVFTMLLAFVILAGRVETSRADIEGVLRAHGVASTRVQTRLAPAWTTDWMTERGRRALAEYGIAPPAERAVDVSGILRRADMPAVACPLCGSLDTRLVSGFGSTSCKALYRCGACREPFDYFKTH